MLKLSTISHSSCSHSLDDSTGVHIIINALKCVQKCLNIYDVHLQVHVCIHCMLSQIQPSVIRHNPCSKVVSANLSEGIVDGGRL